MTDTPAECRWHARSADDTLAALRTRARLPIRLRLTAAPDQADTLQSRLGGQRMNGAALELTCQPHEKMARLAEIAALGPMVSDLDVTPPGLEDLYRHFAEDAQP